MPVEQIRMGFKYRDLMKFATPTLPSDVADAPVLIVMSSGELHEVVGAFVDKQKLSGQPYVVLQASSKLENRNL